MDTYEDLLITNMSELEVGEEYYIKTNKTYIKGGNVFDGIIKIIDNLSDKPYCGLSYVNIIYNDKKIHYITQKNII